MAIHWKIKRGGECHTRFEIAGKEFNLYSFKIKKLRQFPTMIRDKIEGITKKIGNNEKIKSIDMKSFDVAISTVLEFVLPDVAQIFDYIFDLPADKGVDGNFVDDNFDIPLLKTILDETARVNKMDMQKIYKFVSEIMSEFSDFFSLETKKIIKNIQTNINS